MRIMSNDLISVPRELLERITAEPIDIGAQVSRQDAVDELRALLSTCTKDGGQCGLGGYCEPCHSVGQVHQPDAGSVEPA